MSAKAMVVTLNAISGGGKTTVTKEIVDRLENSRAIYFDAYDGVDKNVPDIRQWVEDGADYNLWNLQDMADDISGLLAESKCEYIILDYPFAYKHEQIAQFIDLSVYIDTPLDIALARRILRDASAQGGIDSLLRKLDKYLHKRSDYHHAQALSQDSDITVDGSLKPSAIADIIIEKIKERKHGAIADIG